MAGRVPIRGRHTGRVRLLPFGLAVLASLVILFLPASGVPTAPPGTDKVVHLLLFAVLATTGRVAGLRSWPLVTGLVLYAAGSEMLQAVLPLGRGGDVVDGLVDVAGVLLGAAAHALVRRVSGGAARSDRRGRPATR